MQCTHNHFDLSCNKKQIFCTSHGAEFDLEGNVTRGPAQKKLTSFPVMEESGKLFVQIA
jgi:nitrite reductase/ring-hydroxylating ferredoxin subunit